jgi:hypothetical protein
VAAVTKASVIVLSIATLLSACARTGNDEHAYFTRHGSRYVVELKGRRLLMAHDPISALRGRTSEETLKIEVPRIEGVIEGADIVLTETSFRYAGRIVINKDRMTVDLYDDHRDDHRRVPASWNGEYILVERETATP